MAYDNYLQQSDTASETRTTLDNYLVFPTNWHKHRDLITYDSYLQQSEAATEIWITYDSYLQQSEAATEIWITHDSYLQQSKAATEIWITYDSYIHNKVTQPQKLESPMTATYDTTTQPTQTWTAYANYHLACQWM